MLPSGLLGELVCTCPTGKRPQGSPGHDVKIMCLRCFRKALATSVTRVGSREEGDLGVSA